MIYKFDSLFAEGICHVCFLVCLDNKVIECYIKSEFFMCVYGVSLSIFRKADYFCLYVKLNNSEIEKAFMFICTSFLFIKKRKKKEKEWFLWQITTQEPLAEGSLRWM